VLVCAALAAIAPVAAASTWTVDDDRADCPNAAFTSLQAAVNQAAPHDTLLVCPGTYIEGSTPASSAASPVQAGAHNGLTIDKPLTIKGAGAANVLIEPRTALLGTAPYLRDGGGNVVTISRQSLGSTDADENRVDISGVTIASPVYDAEAGVAFFNTSGSIVDSVVGRGVIETNSLQGGGPGTVRREVTIAGSRVDGDVLFDDSAGGADGAATNNIRSGIIQYGFVEDSHVGGTITYRAGQRGHVTGSEATAIVLHDAETGADPNNPAARAFTASGDTLTSLSNDGASASAPGNWITGAVTGAWETSPLASAPAPLTVPAATADAPPTASIADPLDGDRVRVGSELDPVVVAGDDFGVKSVTLLANGAPVATDRVRPYEFAYTPTRADGPLTLTAVVTDEAGQTTSASIHLTVFNDAAAATGIGATVPATLSLTLGAPASFGSFTPGLDRTYTASTTADVISTAGDATLSAGGPVHLANGAFALPEAVSVSISPASWSAPVSHAPVAIGFTQHVGATDALRTGSYAATLTFTLSTTTP
jgi:hypothetical protein